MREWAQLVGVSALVSMGGLQGCCWDKEDTVAEVEKPIRAEWIDQRTWVQSGGGRNLFPYYPHSATLVRIHTNPETRFAPGCHEPDPELISDSTGARFAFRCVTAHPWRLVHVGSEGRAIIAPDGRLGDGEAPDWSDAPTLQETIAQLVRFRGRLRSAFEELHARDGDEALARVLVSSAEWHDPKSRSDDTPDPWWSSFEELPEPQQQSVKQGLLRRLAEDRLDPAVLETAASALSTQDPGAADALISGASTLLDGPASGAEHDALMRVFWRLADAGDARVGVLGCRAFDHWKEDATVLLTIARHSTRCDAVADHVASSACWAMADCGGEGKFELCSQETLYSEVQSEAKRVAGVELPGKVDVRTSVDRLALAAVYAQGPLPSQLVMAEKRANYEVVQPEGPRCREYGYTKVLPLDEPCECFRGSELADTTCKLEPTPIRGFHDTYACRIRVDDALRKIQVIGLGYGARSNRVATSSSASTSPPPSGSAPAFPSPAPAGSGSGTPPQ